MEPDTAFAWCEDTLLGEGRHPTVGELAEAMDATVTDALFAARAHPRLHVNRQPDGVVALAEIRVRPRMFTGLQIRYRSTNRVVPGHRVTFPRPVTIDRIRRKERQLIERRPDPAIIFATYTEAPDDGKA